MDAYRIDRRAMKLDARDAMRAHKPSVYLVTIVFLIITFVLETLSTKLQFPGLKMQEIVRYAYDEDMVMRLWAAASGRSGTSRLLDFALAVMTVMLSGGFSLFCLRVSQRSEAGVGTLFDLFGYFFRFLWLEIVTGVLIFLWSLLFVIPGIVAAYRYSMAPFIFFEDPKKGALACIQESKAMTMGFKGQLFALDLSFIGWALLSIIPLVSIFVQPYYGVTRANFYRVLSGQYQAAGPQRSGGYGDPWSQ